MGLGSIFKSVAKVVPVVGNILDVASTASNLFGGDKQGEANRANANMQYDFAQNGIRWKVADARAAGISPLVALGAQTMSPSPTYVAGESTLDKLGSLGQSMSRAIHNTRPQDERTEALINLQKRGLELDNDAKEIRNAKMRSDLVTATLPGSGPGLPSSGLVKVNPSEVVTGDVGSPARQPGVITEYQLTAPDRAGSQGIVPSQDMKNRIEDDLIGETLWHLRNRLIAPRHPDPDMYWNPLVQRYVKNPIPRRFRFLP